jgi:hypothetical protein
MAIDEVPAFHRNVVEVTSSSPAPRPGMRRAAALPAPPRAQPMALDEVPAYLRTVEEVTSSSTAMPRPTQAALPAPKRMKAIADATQALVVRAAATPPGGGPSLAEQLLQRLGSEPRVQEVFRSMLGAAPRDAASAPLPRVVSQAVLGSMREALRQQRSSPAAATRNAVLALTNAARPERPFASTAPTGALPLANVAANSSTGSGVQASSTAIVPFASGVRRPRSRENQAEVHQQRGPRRRLPGPGQGAGARRPATQDPPAWRFRPGSRHPPSVSQSHRT